MSKTIGFMIGHESYIPHGKQLMATLKGHQVVPMASPDALPFIEEAKSFFCPPAFKEIPFVDKMMAAAAFEEGVEGSYLWLDVDSLVLTETFDIPLPPGKGIGLRPVDKRNIGTLAGEVPDELWRLLYDYFKLPIATRPMATTVGGEEILPYYNAGFVYVKTPRGLFMRVRAAIEDLLSKEEVWQLLSVSPLYKIFFHQAVLTVAIEALYGDDVYLLPETYNYPLHFHHEHPVPLALQDLKSLRYDTYFETDRQEAYIDRLLIYPKEALRMRWYYDD